ncbi:MAG: DinB, partial [uncultured Thermomicrobiales bacterium]
GLARSPLGSRPLGDETSPGRERRPDRRAVGPGVRHRAPDAAGHVRAHDLQRPVLDRVPGGRPTGRRGVFGRCPARRPLAGRADRRPRALLRGLCRCRATAARRAAPGRDLRRPLRRAQVVRRHRPHGRRAQRGAPHRSAAHPRPPGYARRARSRSWRLGVHGAEYL